MIKLPNDSLAHVPHQTKDLPISRSTQNLPARTLRMRAKKQERPGTALHVIRVGKMQGVVCILATANQPRDRLKDVSREVR